MFVSLLPSTGTVCHCNIPYDMTELTQCSLYTVYNTILCTVYTCELCTQYTVYSILFTVCSQSEIHTRKMSRRWPNNKTLHFWSLLQIFQDAASPLLSLTWYSNKPLKKFCFAVPACRLIVNKRREVYKPQSLMENSCYSSLHKFSGWSV